MDTKKLSTGLAIAGGTAIAIALASRKKGECKVDTDCPVGYICDNGVCVPEIVGCTVDADCPEGYICQNGACVPIAPPPPTTGVLPLCFFKEGGLGNVEKRCIESLYEVDPARHGLHYANYLNRLRDEIIPESAAAYLEQYPATEVIEGPAYFTWFSSPESSNHRLMSDICGEEWEKRWTQPALPATGMKIMLSSMAGKSWTAYFCASVGTSHQTQFVNALQVEGSGSEISAFRDLDKNTWDNWTHGKGIGDLFMVRVESGDNRVVITAPYLTPRHPYKIYGSVCRPEYELLSLEAYHERTLWELEVAYANLIDLYNEYEGFLGRPYCYTSSDQSCIRESYATLSGVYRMPSKWGIWCERVPEGIYMRNLSHVPYTLDEIEMLYNSGVQAENTHYTAYKAFLVELKVKYDQNWGS